MYVAYNYSGVTKARVAGIHVAIGGSTMYMVTYGAIKSKTGSTVVNG